MKKVLFLMFLLFLIVLGTAGVKAQVRMGGNAAPNAAAVLDLNADDTNSGTKGLALPRVSLTNVSTPLTGTPVVNGMMVYNINSSTTGGRGMGIYYWVVDSSKWVKVSDGSFIANAVVDSTNIKNGGVSLSDLTTNGIPKNSTLVYDGTKWVPTPATKTITTTYALGTTFPAYSTLQITDPSAFNGLGVCYWTGSSSGFDTGLHAGSAIILTNTSINPVAPQTLNIYCISTVSPSSPF